MTHPNLSSQRGVNRLWLIDYRICFDSSPIIRHLSTFLRLVLWLSLYFALIFELETNQGPMARKKLNLFELRSHPYGLVISPMLNNFDSHEDKDKAFSVHRHDSYGLFFLRSGEITMMVEEGEIDMGGPSMLVIQPGQVHKCLRYKDISGWVLFFDGGNLDSGIRGVLEQSIEKTLMFKDQGNALVFCDKLLLTIFNGVQDKTPGRFRIQMLHALVNALFYQIANLQPLLKSSAVSPGLRSVQIVQHFKDLIKVEFKTFKRPSEYAGLLHISLSHLNDTVKRLTGYSATHLIQQEIIAEAQRLLRYTNKTGREIACDLGYADDKYFIRLFTKVLGQSPSKFRKIKCAESHQIEADTTPDIIMGNL